MSEDLNQETNEETNEETQEDSNPDQLALEKLNEVTGKNYKSLEDYAKSEKERDKLFSMTPEKREEYLKEKYPEEVKEEDPKPQPKQPTKVNVEEELLLSQNPEAKHVLDELRDMAKEKKTDVLSLYRESKYFQGEAKALETEAKEKEESVNKISDPSNKIESKTDFDNVKDWSDLSDKDQVKYFEKQAEEERLAKIEG